MKSKLSTIFCILALAGVVLTGFASNVGAQDPTVVSKASKIEWDDPNDEGVATSFRIYLSQTPGIVPDGISFVDEVSPCSPYPCQNKWLISSDAGSYFAVVTLVNDDGISIIETGPSNEVWYKVPGPVENAEAVR